MQEFLSCVECLYEPDGEWTTLCAPPAPRAALPAGADGNDAQVRPSPPAAHASSPAPRPALASLPSALCQEPRENGAAAPAH